MSGQATDAMHNTRFYYFAFTYRFFFGRGGPGEARAAHLMLTS
jgi:hypothetical protein